MDDDWKIVEVEPEAVAVNSNGHHDANSLPRTGYGGIGPPVEPVMGNDHAPANGNRANKNLNGHRDEAPEPQIQGPAHHRVSVRLGAQP